MFDWLGIVPVILLTIAVALGIGLVGYGLWSMASFTAESIVTRRRRQRSVAEARAMAGAKFAIATHLAGLEHENAAFCVDCGAAFVSIRWQDGFHPMTGKPFYRYHRGCPKRGQESVWGNCGQRVPVPSMADAHDHPDPTETVLTCPVCLDVMVANGAIKADQAEELYRAAGARTLDTYTADRSSFVIMPTNAMGSSNATGSSKR